MSTLVYGFFTFFSAFLIHLFLWKKSMPYKHTDTLLKIFCGVFVIASTLYATLFTNIFFGIPAPSSWADFIAFFLFYAALSMAYIITYSAIEVDSPSLTMISLIAESACKGVSKNAFKQKLTDNILVIPRVKDLVRDGLAQKDGVFYKITIKGSRFVNIFIFFRRCLNASKGG